MADENNTQPAQEKETVDTNGDKSQGTTEEGKPSPSKKPLSAASGVYIPSALRRLKTESNPFLKMSNGSGQGILATQPEETKEGEGEGEAETEKAPEVEGSTEQKESAATPEAASTPTTPSPNEDNTESAKTQAPTEAKEAEAEAVAETEKTPEEEGKGEEAGGEEGEEGGEEGDEEEGDEEEAAPEDEDAKIRLVPNAPHEGKRVYDTAFLLSFKSICKEKPEGLPDLDITTDSTKRKQGNYQQRDGSDRGRGGWNTRGSGRGGRGRGGKKVIAVPKAPAVAIPPPDEKTWQPSRRVASASDSAIALAKKVKFILNKLTLEKFEPLSQELLELVNTNIADVETFTCVIKQVFDKALTEPQFSRMYAELCLKLQKTCPTFEEEGKKMNFRRILLNECQNEFEQKAAIQEKLEALSAEAKTNEELKLRNRVLNNIVFIGELFQLRMLTDKIMHGGVIKVLLNENPTHLDLEALCKLFTTIGKLLEEKSQAGGQQVMDQYFKRLRGYQSSEEYPSRIRYMLQNVIDLRANRWIDLKDDKPKTREQLSKKIEKEKRLASQNVPRRVPSSGSLTPQGGRKDQAPVPKVQGEWEVVGGKQSQRPARRGEGGRDQKDKGDWEAPPSRGKGGRGDNRKPQQQQQQRRPEGGRGGDNPRAAQGKRGASQGSTPQATRKPQEKDSGNKRPSEPATSANPFELLMGGGEEVEERGGNKKRGASSKQGQGVFVPSYRRQKGAPAAAEQFEEEPVEEQPVKGKSSGEDKNKKIDDEIVMLLEEYLCSHDEQEAGDCLKELDAAIRHHMVIVKGIEMSLEKRELDRAKIASLFGYFKSEGILTELQVSTGFEEVLVKVPTYDADIAPNCSKYIGAFLGKAAAEGVLPLQFLNRALTPLVSSGKALVIAAEALAALAQDKDAEELQKLFKASKIDLLKFVKEEDRNAEFLNKYLEGVKVKETNLSTLLGSS